ncbi:deoxycytidylate deaminase [Escherichia coli]|uniref:anti-phage dCTP deaminase n=1 Tax=Escherichia coli TaxID=562 RepID=UPI000DDE7027|nr:anti-phage dCTP deaminase [Escherichia coli]EFH5222950.1 deoxycytidylate deaminase [Escherichia coli]EFH5826456.1 deoxycytidylate deaminase [Escherichia coli]EFH7161417.1 deoxycytidylate deaminase [Escherichia coli]EHT3682502.1 deoxycytidylate deaminase [Escherichia coli]RBJ01544.1 deoxycytidylate deaminase [Escherichia coli]
MADSAKKIESFNTSNIYNSDSIRDIEKRNSQELIIGLCGAIGSGVKTLKNQMINALRSSGYHVEHIRVSDLIAKCNNENAKNLSGFERYKRLQDLGDNLRKEHNGSICAELSIHEIQIRREMQYGDDSENLIKNLSKTAYIVDQIKHPDEVKLFRVVYKNNFYLVGLLRTEAERKLNLKDEGIEEKNIAELIERDRKSSDKLGQQVDESLQLSDYFIKNLDMGAMNESVQRLINLIHGTNYETPTRDESGMYAAYSASLGSACLSRQVGASIVDLDGNIISVGRNDVPKYGGGLYSSEDENNSCCFKKQGCHNDKHKNLLKEQIVKALNANGCSNAENLADIIMKETKAKDLIEYSRAVHAEMDAIIALARNANGETKGGTLYCTTYPCHICARHIVAAGIKRVVYIEPYEKSLALDLHYDSICQSDKDSSSTKVLFENFEGVAPKRYAKFFGHGRRRKDNTGKPIMYSIDESYHVDSQHLDNYMELESKVVQNLDRKI